MSKQDNLTDFLTDVADAIREKKGTTEKINPQNFSEEIRGIESGGGGNINATIEVISPTSFGPNSYKSVVIHEGVTELLAYAIYYANNMTYLKLPSTLVKIGNSAVDGAWNIAQLDIPNGVTSIGYGAFSNARKIKTVKIPNATTTIGGSAFRYCSMLDSVDIGTGVTSIGELCFANGAVKMVTIRAINPPSIGTNTFVPMPSAIYVPDESVEAYKSATNWSAYADIIKPLSEYQPTNE